MRPIETTRRHLAACLLGLAAPGVLAAQAAPAPSAADTTVVVTAGARYGADGLKARFLGEDYRDLWTTPLRVPVLDLATYAGGLTPTERGGGLQTQVLHLRSAEGRDYVFRSVDKRPHLTREPALQGTVIQDVIQDQVSSLQPAGALVVAPLLDAVGVLHATPRLVVMPDVPALGEFREEFAGVLGWIEERPNEVEDGARPGFGGFTRITGTDRLLERLEESPRDRVAAREYLTARLMDLFLGDWDRHYDQWRWAEVERDGVSYWRPIPRDRDYAFVNYDGWFMRVGRNFFPNGVRFGPEIDNVYGLTLNAQQLDRRLLAGLELAEWDSVAAFVQDRLTDSVIDAAVRRLPPEYHALRGAEMAADLKARRSEIRTEARTFYERLAGEVDVRATDERDVAVVERQADDVVRVRLYARAEGAGGGEAAGAPYYERRFYAPETREVRVYLHGGDDYAVVRGDVGESLMVRVIGGGGDDVLVDSSAVRTDRAETAFYDDRGENRFVRADGTAVSTRAWEEPEAGVPLSGQGWRDWGSSSGVQPYLNYQEIDGLIVGGGYTYTRQGFRRYPFAYRLGARGMVGLGSWNVAGEVFGVWNRTNSPVSYSVSLLGTQLDNFRFFGFGNDTEPFADRRLYKVELDQVVLGGAVGLPLPAGGRLQVGPILKYTNPDVPEGSPLGELPRYGNDGFGQVGARAEARFDWRDEAAYPERGARLRLNGSAYPGVWDAEEAFGSALVEATGYLTPPWGWPVTLALRAGGERVWGEFPVHESAFLGGSRTVRGYSYQRFAGDASLFGGAELRAPLFAANLILLRGTIGGLLLADAGRVYFRGRSEGDWHTAAGAGLWFRFRLRDSDYVLSTTYAQGEDGKVYLKLGVPF